VNPSPSLPGGGDIQPSAHPEFGEVEANRKRQSGPATGDSVSVSDRSQWAAAVSSDSIQNGPMQALRPALQRPRVHWCKEHQSGLWVEQSPRHGPDLIEGLKGPVGVDDSSLSEELQVTVEPSALDIGWPPAIPSFARPGGIHAQCRNNTDRCRRCCRCTLFTVAARRRCPCSLPLKTAF